MTPNRLPLRPIESDFLPTLRRANEQRDLTREIAAAAMKRGIRRLIFTGVGGSWASSIPATVQLASSGGPISVENINATELSDLYLDGIDSSTMVLATSHSGGTHETVAAAEAAAERGALLVSLATSDSNPLAAAAHFTMAYGSERTITPAKYLLLSELTASIREAALGADVSGLRSALSAMPEAVLADVKAGGNRLQDIADRFSHEDRTHILAAGPQFGLAYMLSVCYLVEMQTKHTTHLAAADFFHGPFEIAVDRQPYILLAGEDSTRPQLDRVKKFLDRYDDNYAVLDTADLELDGVEPELRGAVGHIAQAAIVQRLAEHFESVSGQNLDTRRYMHKVEY